MLTIRPKPRAAMPSTAWRQRLNTPSRLTRSTASHCSRCILRRVVSRVMPAALTRMSSEPCAATMPSTSRPQASKSETSPAAKRMSSPAVSRAKASMRSSRSPRSMATTVRPCAASDLQIAVPRPPMPPVTAAMRLSNVDPPKAVLFAALGGVLVLARGGRVGVAPHAGDQVLLEVLPHFHVALGELVHHRPGRLPEHAAHLLAELRLLLHEGLHGAVEVGAHEALQRVPVQADDLAQQLGRQHRLPVLFMLGDDLQQHLAGEVVAALGVADLEVLAIDDELADVFDGDVARDVGVVEAAVRILLDDARLGHGAKALTDASPQHGA